MENNTEVWKDIKGYEGLYQVSSNGRVKSCAKGITKNRIRKEKILKSSANLGGYLNVVLTKNKERRSLYVHRLVGVAFIENPESKPQINHINSLRSDNKYTNLEWCTSKRKYTSWFLQRKH